jgi:hypothetical protein
VAAPGPLRYRFSVDCEPDDAFRLWTLSFGLWWPMATHSSSGERDATLTIEPREGGRIVERSADGREFDWGRVALWEPPHRLVCDWYVAMWNTATGTHREALFGIPPTGNRIRMKDFHLFCFFDGKIVEHWNQVNVVPDE